MEGLFRMSRPSVFSQTVLQISVKDSTIEEKIEEE